MHDAASHRMDPSLPEKLERSSSLAFARSLFHAAEGKELLGLDLSFASTVSTYYSLFHLGEAMILAYCSCPAPPGDRHAPIREALEKRWSTRTNALPSNALYDFPDPAAGIDHKNVPVFLQRELPEIIETLGSKGQRGTLFDMREFVSYGPRMVSRGSTNVLYSGCQYEPEDFKSHLRRHLGRVDQIFCDCLRWTKRKGFTRVYARILTGDFVLFEFDELRAYHTDSVVKRALVAYRLLCEQEGADWRTYRPDPDPETWHQDNSIGRERYAVAIRLLSP